MGTCPLAAHKPKKILPAAPSYLFLMLVTSLSFWSCAPLPPSVPEDVMKKEVSDFFVKPKLSIRDKDAEYLYKALSRESCEWIENIRSASHTEPLRFQRDRLFHEVLLIFALRMEIRYNSEFDDNPVNFIRKVVIETYAIKKAFLRSAQDLSGYTETKPKSVSTMLPIPPCFSL